MATAPIQPLAWEPPYATGAAQEIAKKDKKKMRKRKLNIELPFDPAIPLLGIYPEKTMTHKDTCTPVFIAALFTIAKTWKQPKRPSTEEWIQKIWYIYAQWNMAQPSKRTKYPYF